MEQHERRPLVLSPLLKLPTAPEHLVGDFDRFAFTVTSLRP
jgi:hypothetical protein